MSSVQRQNVINQQIANDQAHKEKMERERELQKAVASKFDSDLARSDAAISENFRQTRNAATDHQDTLNKMKIVENDLLRELNSVHSEKKKEHAKAANRELDALQTSEAANQAAMMAHQSSEKKRIEESRRQADKEAAEKIENARAHTSKAAEIAHEQDKERTEYLTKVEKDQVAEIGAMKRELLENDKLEFERLEIHGKKMQSIGYARIAATVQMDSAEEQMRKNRNASEEISAVTDDIFSLRTKMNELSSKVNVAHDLKKPDTLKKQYSMIMRTDQAIKTIQSGIATKLSVLLKLTIDNHDEERRSVMNLVLEDLQKLEDLHSGINFLAPQKQGIVGMEFVLDLKKYTDKGADDVENLSCLWGSVPPIDKTNLIHASFLNTTSVLMDETKLMAVEKPEVLALEGTEE